MSQLNPFHWNLKEYIIRKEFFSLQIVIDRWRIKYDISNVT